MHNVWRAVKYFLSSLLLGVTITYFGTFFYIECAVKSGLRKELALTSSLSILIVVCTRIILRKIALLRKDLLPDAKVNANVIDTPSAHISPNQSEDVNK